MKICAKCKEREAIPNYCYCLECKTQYTRNRSVINSKKKFKDANPDTFVVCEICGLHSSSLTTHLNSVHNMTGKEYVEKYNKPFQSVKYLQDLSERIKGDKNFHHFLINL
jgi:hypothetical protein